MTVGQTQVEFRKQALQIQCDLLRAGLVPGVTKCIWTPVPKVKLNGLLFDFERCGIAVLEHRMEHTMEKVTYLLNNWPSVTFREVSQLLGQLNSMHPVLRGLATLRSKFLQT
jgi:hypothetical protein